MALPCSKGFILAINKFAHFDPAPTPPDLRMSSKITSRTISFQTARPLQTPSSAPAVAIHPGSSQPYGLPPLRTGRATGLANAAVDKGGRGTISVDTLARLPVLGGTGMAGAMGAKTCAANF
ncbi:hypothetical protein PtB15_8B587 [Puccinia triticina]|nr:hypothetical protein PtB15_8B587 [Puccinia triticina]